MWMVGFIIAIAATLVLIFHITLELNRLDKSVNEMFELLKKYYGN